MKTRLLTLAIFGCFALAGFVRAQAPGAAKAPPAKTPADLAYDEFNKVRNAPGEKNQARFHAVITAGATFLAQYPTHNRAGEVVNNLAFFGNSIDRKQAEMRTSYLSFLKLEVANQKFKEGVTDAAKAALVAVEAAVADFEAREQLTPANLANFREKVDALAEETAGARFLVDRERSYVQILSFDRTPQALGRAEVHLKKLIEHKDKGVAGMARTELNLVEAKKAPFSLAFTALDGKPVDFAQLRGKVVALYFWSSTNKTSLDNIDTLKQVYSDYRKRGFEIVTVSYDKAEDQAKVAAAVKDNRITFPVHYDGKGAKSEFAAKLNVGNVPALLLFDQKGMLLHSLQGPSLTINLPVNQLEGQVKRLLGIK